VKPLQMLGSVCLLTFALAPAWAQQPASRDASWPTYGGDPGGQRYSSAAQINKGNVDRLKVAWTFHTGVPAAANALRNSASFEATPILFKGSLYLASPFDEVFAVDPETGVKRWSYDPRIDWGRSNARYDGRGSADRNVERRWSHGDRRRPGVHGRIGRSVPARL
jgi:quinoprotein glucose dehydrogenase